MNFQTGKMYKLAVIGATGVVGQKIIEILKERQFPVRTLIPVASKRSLGNIVKFNGEDIGIEDCAAALSKRPNLALFSAGSDVSVKWAPEFAGTGCTVIDNSSAWRMDPSKKLIVPEINASLIRKTDKIIANPNCSTIQLVMVIAPLHRAFGIKRIVVSTYQSVTGTGMKAIRQLENERRGYIGEKAYPYPIDMNCIPQCDDFLENGYTKEEMKIINETGKILNDASLMITATAVRVPVTGGHSESVNIEFSREVSVNAVIDLLKATPGITVEDEPAAAKYPMPLNAQNKNEVFVGRIRKDYSRKNAVNMWIVSDNLRKGAATNAVQIAEYLHEKNFL